MTDEPSPYAHDMLEAFASWLSERGISFGTVLAYCGDVRTVLAALAAGGEPVRVAELDPNEAVLAIVRDAKSQTISAATARRRDTAMRRFVEFLEQAKGLPLPRITRTLRMTNEYALQTPVEMAKISAVLSAPDTDTPQGLRDRALLEVLFDTGMQVTELCALRVEDWDPEERRLAVGKGKRRRQVRVLIAGIYIDAHLHVLGDAEPSSPLFPSRSGGSLNLRDIGRAIDKYAVQAGLEAGDVTPQMIIAAGRMHMINLWPERAKAELGYNQLSAARRRYSHTELAAQGATEGAPDSRLPARAELTAIARDVASVQETGGQDGISAGDHRWLLHALKRGVPPPRHGFPPPPPLGTFARYRSLIPDERLTHRMHFAAIGHALRPLMETVDRRARNRRGSEILPDPAAVVALRGELLCVDPRMELPAWLAEGSLEAGMQSPDILAAAERVMDPGASQEVVMQRVTKELARRDRASRERLDAVVEGRVPQAFSRDDPIAPTLVDNLLRGPYFAVQFLEGMLSGGAGWPAFAWLADQLWPFMGRAYACAAEYYAVPGPEAWNDASVGALVVSMVIALIRTSPRALHKAGLGVPLEHIILPYFERAFVECLAGNLAVAHDLPPLWNRLEDMGSSRRFVSAFEREWELVLPYTDGRFGFRAVPRLSVEAVQLYLSTVSWNAEGRRRAIRHEILDYIVHRGLWVGETISAQLPRRWEEAIWTILAPFMEPLVQAQARRVHAKCPDLQIAAVAADLRRELRDLVDRYDPHKRFHDEVSGVARGAIGAERRADVAERAARLGVAPRQRPLPLVCFLERELKRIAAGRISKDLDAITGDRRPMIQGPDGREYLTVGGAIRRLRCSAQQVRRLDGVLCPMRLHEVWPGRGPEQYRHLPRNTRLYPVDATPWESAELELKKRQTRASGIPRGYARRAVVARRLGVHASTLLRWERQGHIAPMRRGRNVLYSGDNMRMAEKLRRMAKGDAPR